MSLTDLDRATLELEQLWWRRAGAKEAAIRERLGVTAVAHYQRVVRLVNDPPADLAVEFAPLLARLRRQMDAQARLRRAS